MALNLTSDDLKAIGELLDSKLGSRFEKLDNELSDYFESIARDFLRVDRKLDAVRYSFSNLIRELHYKGISVQEEHVMVTPRLEDLEERSV